MVVFLVLLTISLASLSYFRGSIDNQAVLVSKKHDTASENLKSGSVGEIADPKENPDANTNLPSVVFNTSGTIMEIKENGITVNGNGSNFYDGKARKLTVTFASDTTVSLLGQKEKYQGTDGLKLLKAGSKILVSGKENIRGKEEFEAKTVNIMP